MKENIIKTNQESLSFPKTKQYLESKFVELENDYRSSDGIHSESCGLIARDVARLIVSEGGNPEILFIQGKEVDIVHILANEFLEPRRYAGRVSWGGHTVCENENIIYDPLVGIPMDKETYLRTTFLDIAKAEVSISKDKVKDFIK